MGNIYLTITVPSYNISQYITRCLESFSVIDKKYQSMFEVLVINDGSTDDTVEVAKSVIANHLFDNIKIVDKPNGGHGSTVNKGLELAKGCYFKVIDGDDWVDKGQFELLLDKLKEASEDMIITDYTKQYIEDGIEELVQPLATSLANQVYPGIPSTRIPMHSIAYRTQLLRDCNLKLSEGIFYVDLQYTLFPLSHLKSWVYYPLNVYQYLLGRQGQSVNIESFIRNSSHHITVMQSIIEFKTKVIDYQLLKVIDETLIKLFDMQLKIDLLSKNAHECISRTKQLIAKSGISYTIKTASKLSYLIYGFGSVSILEKLIKQIVRAKVGK